MQIANAIQLGPDSRMAAKPCRNKAGYLFQINMLCCQQVTKTGAAPCRRGDWVLLYQVSTLSGFDQNMASTIDRGSDLKCRRGYLGHPLRPRSGMPDAA